MNKEHDDINQIIASAVNARVEAAALEAMTNDNTMRTFVQAALNQKSREGYGREVEEGARAEGRREVLDALRLFRDEADRPLAVDLGTMVRARLDEREAGR